METLQNIFGITSINNVKEINEVGKFKTYSIKLKGYALSQFEGYNQ